MARTQHDPRLSQWYEAQAHYLIRRWGLPSAPEIVAESFLVSGQGGFGRYRANALAVVVDAAGGLAHAERDDDHWTDRHLEYVTTADVARGLTFILPSVAVQMDRYSMVAALEHIQGVPYNTPDLRERAGDFYASSLYGYCEGVGARIRQNDAHLRAEIPDLWDSRQLVRAEFERRYPGSRPVGRLDLNQAGLLAGAEVGRVAGIEITRETGR